MVKLNLEETGKYIIRTENIGRGALAAAREFKPHIILLDIVMPDMNRGKIAHNISLDEELSRIPVVFLTAIVKEGEVNSQAGIIGGHPFIAKPVTTDKLIACIEENT